MSELSDVYKCSGCGITLSVYQAHICKGATKGDYEQLKRQYDQLNNENRELRVQLEQRAINELNDTYDIEIRVLKAELAEARKERDELNDRLEGYYDSASQASYDMYSEQVAPLALELNKYKTWALEARALLQYLWVNNCIALLTDNIKAEELLAQFPQRLQPETEETGDE